MTASKYLDRLASAGYQPTKRADLPGWIEQVPLKYVDYSQSHCTPWPWISPDYAPRDDCSGATAGGYRWPLLGAGGDSTATSATRGVIYPIKWADAKPYDIFGNCGPGTDSSGHANGHMGILLSVLADGMIKVWDHGNGRGPIVRTIPRGTYKAWRYVFLDDAQPPTLASPGDSLWTDYRRGCFGGIVYDIQDAINRDGNPNPLKLDGDFGTLTYYGVRWFQKKHGLVEDGIVGPRTSAALLATGDVDNPNVRNLHIIATDIRYLANHLVPAAIPNTATQLRNDADAIDENARALA